MVASSAVRSLKWQLPPGALIQGALRASAAGAGGCAWSRWPTAGPLTVLSARIRRARPCRGRSPACLVFSGRWPMEGEAVPRGRGPGARGGDGRWPARGALSPGGPPAAARRRPTAVFVRGATARAEPVRRGESRPSRRSSSAAGVRTSRGGDDTSDSKTLPEYSRDPHAMEGASRCIRVLGVSVARGRRPRRRSRG